MVFAVAEASGVTLSPQFIKYASLPKAISGLVIGMIMFNFVIKFADVTESNTVWLFLLEAFILGSFYNLAFLT
jgi:hypothetical protein